jgi:1-acyl-sn-glycerol-3-phosphate acyltransferase
MSDDISIDKNLDPARGAMHQPVAGVRRAMPDHPGLVSFEDLRCAGAQKFKATAYTVWCWFGCGLSTACWATIPILGSLFSRTGRLQHVCMRRWSRDNLWLSRARVEIEGLENIGRDHPQTFISNHSGLHDILALSAHLPIQFRWVAKKSLFSVPFMGWHMSRAGYIAIDRDNPRQTAKSIIEAASIIRAGTYAIAFPEGTRSRTGSLGEFHSGIFALALRSGVPWCRSAWKGATG